MPSKSEYLDVAKDFTKNVGFVLGFRKAYKVENLLTLLGLVTFIVSYFFVWGNSIYTAVVTGVILLAPALLQFIQYRRKLKYITDKKLRARIPPPSVPLFTIIVSAILSGIMPPLVVVAVINAAFIEDVTVFFAEVDVVKMKREFRILLEPVTKRELFSLSASAIGSALLAFFVTGNPLVFVYPVVSYIMLVYSLILVPPEYRMESRGGNILEEISRRVPFLYFLFMQYYQSPKRIRLGKEAGMVGASYYTFIKRMAGLFTLSLYGSLAATPILYIFIGNYAFAAPVLVSLPMFIMPQLLFTMKRNSRASKINRNLMLILSYLAAMASVAEDFTSAMQNLKYTPALAKMFGLEQEVSIYLNIYRAKNSPDLAMEEYADSIPDDFYRDTIRAIKDISENEGYGAVFRALIARLRDYTTRHIDRIASTFENIGGNTISVIILMETTIPIMLFLSNPTMMPILMLMGGIISAFMVSTISSMTLPDLPSEFIHAKERYRKGAAVFALTGSMLSLLEYIMLPELAHILIPLNVVPSFFMTLYYVSYEDLALNNEYLSKFPDLLILFSSSMIRQSNVEKALLDLSQQATFPVRMRRTFQKLANIFGFMSAERLTYRGPYWYKYFMFLASISGRYGTTPRQLYKTISDFMLEYKKFFDMVNSFGKSILFMTLIALIVMNVEVVISINFLQVMSQLHLARVTAQFGVQSPIPELTPAELEQMKMMSYMALIITSLANGVAVAKAVSGTFRDGKWVLFLFVIQLILLYVGIHTSFGIHFGTHHAAVKPP